MAKRKRRGMTPRQIAYQKRLGALQKKLLSGCTNESELAVAFNVHPATIRNWVEKLKGRWSERLINDVEGKRTFRVEQMQHIGFLALSAFEKSQKKAVEYTTQERICTDCNGEGEVEEKPNTFEKCLKCKGEGTLTTETTKIKGQAGDSSFLRVAKECFLEAAKLEGVAAPDDKMRLSTILSDSKQLSDGNLQQQVAEMYLEAPSDLIIEALRAHDELREKVKQKTKSVERIADDRPDENVIDSEFTSRNSNDAIDEDNNSTESE